MKTLLKLLLGAALLLMAFAGRSQCNAAFTINNNGLGSLQFLPSNYPYYGDSITYFLWSFGDGAGDTSFQAAVTHKYASSGTYTVCLTVIDSSNNCSNQSCDTISASLCSGSSQFEVSQIGFGEYSFNATAILGNAAYTGTWNFGDGTYGSGPSATHQYTSDGIYNACFSVAGPGGCLDTTCQIITIALCQPFNFDFTYHVVSVNPYTAEFVAVNPNPTYNYQWVSSNGSYASGDSVQFAFNTNVTDTMTLSVFSNTYGCVDSVKHVLAVDRCNLFPNVNITSNGLDANFYVYLTDTPNVTVTNLWNFPGGNPSTSTNSNVGVTYSSLGTYNTSLYLSTETGCVDTLYDTFTLTPPVYYIEGQISAGSHGGQAAVYLIVQDSIGHLALVDSTTVNLGDSISTNYYFDNLPVDTYYVKAAITSVNDTDYANYLPTYYTSSLSWTTATAIDLSGGAASNINIDLIPGNNPGGSGFVGGYVSAGAGIDLHIGNQNIFRSVGDPLAGVQINLVTSADEAVAYTFTDVNGHYQFNDLAYGDYKIYADQLNKIPSPIPFTLSGSDSSISNLNMSVNSDSATATGIKQGSTIAIQGVYPNPVVNMLEVQLSSKQATNATIKLVDVLGQTTITNNTKLAVGNNKLELSMENLAAGVYQMLIQTNNQQLTYKIVKAR